MVCGVCDTRILEYLHDDAIVPAGEQSVMLSSAAIGSVYHDRAVVIVGISCQRSNRVAGGRSNRKREKNCQCFRHEDILQLEISGG